VAGDHKSPPTREDKSWPLRIKPPRRPATFPISANKRQRVITAGHRATPRCSPTIPVAGFEQFPNSFEARWLPGPPATNTFPVGQQYRPPHNCGDEIQCVSRRRPKVPGGWIIKFPKNEFSAPPWPAPCHFATTSSPGKIRRHISGGTCVGSMLPRGRIGKIWEFVNGGPDVIQAHPPPATFSFRQTESPRDPPRARAHRIGHRSRHPVAGFVKSPRCSPGVPAVAQPATITGCHWATNGPAFGTTRPVLQRPEGNERLDENPCHANRKQEAANIKTQQRRRDSFIVFFLCCSGNESKKRACQKWRDAF